MSIFLASALNAQWSKTNVTNNPLEGIADLCEHNGELFTSTWGGGLLKLNNASNVWDTVQTSLAPNTNSAHITHLASSGNSLYAIVRDQLHASTTIYKSSDAGINFVKDTVGQPIYTYPASVAGYGYDIHDVFVLSGKIIIVMGGGFYSKYPADAAWVPETNPSVKFSESFAEYDNTWYAWSDNYKVHISVDQGQTWTTPANTGLPTMFYAKVMDINPSSGRIYIAGKSLSTDKYNMLYSDNAGTSWDTLAINQYLGTNWMNQKQVIKGMISKGNNITAMLENNLNNSHADVIRSTDGGVTFSVDTVGLYPTSFGTILVNKFLYFNNKLYFGANYNDIYVQGEGVTAVKELSAIHVKVYPNPFTKNVTVESATSINSIQILNMMGQVVHSEMPLSKDFEINLEGVAKGVYFVNIQTNDQLKTVKIVKN